LLPAYLSSEVGEMLPIRVGTGKRKTPRNKFYCNWDKKSGVHKQISADTECNARAEMLCFLLSEGLIK